MKNGNAGKIGDGTLLGNATLTARWTPMRYHATQAALMASTARFRVVPAGRRSGKSELAKRNMVLRMLEEAVDRPDGRYALAAPTRDQAKQIFWEDVKALTPQVLMDGRPLETELRLRLVTGSEVRVIGMDKPERVEGVPLDGIVVDEYGNMKASAWTAHIRPALSDRLGWAWLIGVPEGRNHYYKTYRNALADDSGTWGVYHWISADILPPDEVEQARRDLDELTFKQEYEADFVLFAGRAYHAFTDSVNVARLEYNPRAPLLFCFDFNVSPGVAVVCQRMRLPTGVDGIGVIGEVWIPQNSTTPAVCRKLMADYGSHGGPVICYGDATGGAGGTASVSGSDWSIIRAIFHHEGPWPRAHVRYKVPLSNPRERVRVNAVNSLCRAANGDVRLCVDPVRAPHVIVDFEGVRLLEGGSGEIDKKHDPDLTHLTDALGYMVAMEYPVAREYRLQPRRYWK